jgi:hypothetical protein
VPQEVIESINQLHKTDNFHFAHLLVVVYEADQIRQTITEGDHESASLTQQTMALLIEFIISFISQNRGAIKASLAQHANTSPVSEEML